LLVDIIPSLGFLTARSREGSYLEDSRPGKATSVKSIAQSTEMGDLFAYGTLKRGFTAHRRYCGDAVFVAKAAVRGRLHVHPHGYPVLVLAPSTLSTGEDWRWIEGEILRLRNPAWTLARIDAYEGVIPGICGSYLRVRVPVRAPGVRVAWAYAARTADRAAHLPVHPSPCWP